MTRIFACVLAMIVVTIPAAVLALGLGNVEVSTTLNEPLRAKVPLTRVNPGDLAGIDVRLGTTEQFSRAGLERPFYLSRLKFEVVPDGETGAHVRITTKDPVTEPFLNFLVELNWTSGRMIREYTLLLDPPVYGAAISTATKSSVATVEALPESSAPAPVTRVTAPEPAPAPAPAAPTAPAAISPPTVTAAVAPPDLAGASDYGPVVAQETLWSIAGRVRPDEGVSVQRMMLAILEANPEAFSIGNINALKKGAVLRIPERSEIGVDDKQAAMAEVRRQQALWDEFRGQVAAAPAPGPEGAPAVSAPSAAEPSVAPAATTEDAARIEIVAAGDAQAAGAPGDAADSATLRNELNVALEEADSKQRENEELGARLAETEQLISDLNRMLELKDDEIAQLQETLRQQDGAAAAAPEAQPMPSPEAMPSPEPMPSPEAMPSPEPMPTPEPAPAPEPAPVAEPQPEPAPAPPPVATAPRPPASFVDELLGTVRSYLPADILGYDPILVVGGLGGLALILGGGTALVRRRKAAEEGEPSAITFDDEESMIEKYAAESDSTEVPEGPAPDDADDKTLLVGSDEVTEVPGAAAGEGDDDPLSELNVYMAYEHFDQAEELVRGAIAQHPDRHDYRLKLLGVFAAAKDLPSFQETARELRDAAGEGSPLMADASRMWRELAPGRDLFGGPQDAATAVDSGEDEVFDVTSGGDDEDADSGVDFDLGFEMTGGEDQEPDSQGSSSSVDFDLTGDEEAEPEADDGAVEFDIGDAESPEAEPAGSGSEVDFDLGEDSADASEAIDDGASDLDFDLTGDAEEAEEAPAETAAEAAGDDNGLDFDLGGGADMEETIDPGLGESSGGDLDFSLDSGDAEEAAQEDSGLDFDLGGDEPQEAAAGGDAAGSVLEDFHDSATLTGDETAVDADSGLDFDIGDAGAEAAAGDSDSGLSLDIDDSGSDFDIGEGASEAASDDSGLELAVDSGDSGLDLDLDAGGAEDAPPAPKSPGIDTVHLTQEKVDELEAADSGEGEAEDEGLDFNIGDETVDGDAGDEDVGVDTVFKGVFDESGDGAAETSLDLDTGLDEGGATDEALDLDIGGASGDAPELEIGGGGDDLPELSIDGESDEAGGLELDSADESSDSGIDFALDAGEGGGEEADEDESGFEATQFMLRDVKAADDSGGDDDDEEDKTLVLGRTESGEVDDIQTKLDLAEAYIEMGDTDGARGILDEVVNEGSDAQKEQANNLLAKLS